MGKFKGLLKGAMLEDRYRIRDLLNQGGMGAIYQAYDTRLKTRVAIKENFFQEEESINQFEEEAIILARLHHPHLPRVLNHFMIEERQYLVMDFIDGKDLWEMAKARKGPLKANRAIEYIIQVCDAVDYLHKQDPKPIIHRDIKPQNIKVDSLGQAMLVDFGIAKVGGADTRTRRGAEGITVGFSPPEQYLAHSRTSPASDIYALGATLYAVLLGIEPPDSLSLMMGEAKFEPPETSKFKIHPQLYGVIKHAMQVQMAQRPGSVTAWQKELTVILDTIGEEELVTTESNAFKKILTGTGRLVNRNPTTPNTQQDGIANRNETPVQPKQSATPSIKIWERDGKAIVRVPAGEFMYGKKKEKIHLPEFWIDQTPVTNAEYARFVEDTGRKFPEHWKVRKFLKSHKTLPEEISDHPVTHVSLDDADAYAQWAGKRLPTEEEWEKAARGVDDRPYPWGDQEPSPVLCNFNKNKKRITAVGQFSPRGDSPYGCIDMVGNVWEWTTSTYNSKTVVIRGGDWGSRAKSIHLTTRNKAKPASSSSKCGFRCVVDPDLL